MRAHRRCLPRGGTAAPRPQRLREARCAAARFILALDAGTTSSRSLIFDDRGRVVAQAQREFTQYFPQPGWVEHDAQRDLGYRSAPRWSMRLRAAQADGRATSPRSASPTSARPRCCGIAPPAHPWRPPSSGRTGAPPQPAKPLRAAGLEAEIASAHRPAARSVFLRQPNSPGCSIMCQGARATRGARRAGVRHHRQLAAVQTHRAPAPRHRRHQRQPHPAVQPAAGRLGRAPARNAAHAARLPAGDRRLQPASRRGTSRSSSTASNYRQRASPATSRPRCSARAVSRPAWPRTPTAPAVSR